MEPEMLKNPAFLLCEFPIKDNELTADRIFIYCVNQLSLIECFCEDDILIAFETDQLQKNFKYINSDGHLEIWYFVLTQNNTSLMDCDPVKLLDIAWEWFKEYLIWEDED